MGSSSKLLIMNVAEADREPFCEDESDWPLRHYEEVYMVTTTLVRRTPRCSLRSSRAQPALKLYVLTADTALTATVRITA